MNDFVSNLDVTKIPARADVGFADAEVLGEGQRVILSDGQEVGWNPPPTQPVMPDWSQIKSIRHYFGRSNHPTYPAWLYHPTEEPRLVKNAAEAKALGVFYRQATIDERGRYGIRAVWDWEEGCLWRSQPHHAPKFNPLKLENGKNYVPTAPNPVNAQNALIESLIPAVAAAVAQSLKATGPGAPADIDPAQWDAFLQFQAWQKSAEAVKSLEMEPEEPAVDEAQDGNAPSNALSPEQDRALWVAEAERKGVKIDKRWGVDRIKSEIDKAA